MPKLTSRVLAVGLAALFLCPMFHASLIPPTFLDCVVALGRKVMNPATHQVQWTPEASGFLYGEFVSKVDETHSTYQVFLVTNRHVIEDHAAATSDPLSVRFNLNSPGSAREYDVPLHDERGRPTWHFHPNPSIDIAVVPINGAFLMAEGAKFKHFESDSDLLTRAKAKELGLSEGDGVYVLGFPMGLTGQREDYVIVRQGAIARVRDTLESPAISSFLIDSFIFPGNSGGPVVLRPEISSIAGSKPAIQKAYLWGVVKGYLPYTDAAVSPQTKHLRVTFEENSGLAEVIPADYIEETIADYTKSIAAPH
jgi:hypothetical protein